MRLELADLVDLSRGAAFLGTGGGGDPYIGRLMVEQAMREGHAVEIIDLESLPDDALVIPTAIMGAPTVIVEKLPSGEETIASLHKLEAFLGRKAFATMPIEVGGINSTMPLVVGARLGLPVVDADGMGRAFPELQMETFAVYGVPGAPMVVSNEYGDSALIETADNKMLEWIARGVTIRMGGTGFIAEYAMDGATAKRTSVPGTLSLAIEIGACIGGAREAHKDPFAELLDLLPKTPYAFGKIIFKGKIADLFRETSQGFAKGRVRIAGLEGWTGTMEIDIQNENLVARHDGEIKAIVPDLICVMDSETAETITTETLRYGQRVTVMGVAVPPIMRTPEALAVFGPTGFGIDAPFTPIEALD